MADERVRVMLAMTDTTYHDLFDDAPRLRAVLDVTDPEPLRHQVHRAELAVQA